MTVAQLEQPRLTDEELDLTVYENEPSGYAVEEIIKYPKNLEKFLDPRLVTLSTCISGESVQSLVVKARDQKTDKLVGMKQYFGPEADRDTDHEAKVQNWLAGRTNVLPATIKPVALFNESSKINTLITPWIAEGSWYGKVAKEGGAESVRDALEDIARVAGTLSVMHAAGLVHGDVRPSNYLRGGYLTDFGTVRAIMAARSRSRDFIYTPGYAAKEVVKEELVVPESDVYALMVSTYVVLKGSLPYAQHLGQSNYESGISNKIPQLGQRLSMLSLDTIDMLSAASDPDFKNRPTAAEFQAKINSEIVAQTAGV